jgi:tetratricopeptide (TPR) repeat protein
MRFPTILCVFLLSLFPLKADETFEVYQEEVLQKLVEGNYLSVQKALIKLIKQNFLLPECEVFFRHLENTIDQTGHYQEAEKLCNFLLARPERLSNTLRARALAMKLRISINRGKVKEAQKWRKKLGFITEWYLIGPFNNEGGEGFKKVYPPEEKISLSRTYHGARNKVGWFLFSLKPLFGLIDLGAIFSFPPAAVAYALTFFYLPQDQEIEIRTGSDGALKVWVDHQLILIQPEYRRIDLDQDFVRLRLKKGWHKVLVKSARQEGDWGFYFRLTDEEGRGLKNLQLTPHPPPDFSPQSKVEFEEILPDAIKKLILYDEELNHSYLGYLYYDYDLKELALEEYETAAQFNPNCSFYHFIQGLILENKGWIQSAIILYKKALKISPTCLEAKRRLALLLADERREEEAIKLLQEVVKANPNFLQAYLNLSNRYYLKGWDLEAISLAQQAVKINPKMPLPHYYLGYFYTQQQNYKKAIFHYTQALKLNYFYHEIRLDLIRLLYQAGKIKEAVKLAQEGLALDPLELSLYLKLGQIYLSLEKNKEALKVYLTILKFSPYYPEAYKKIGLIYHREKDKKETLTWWKKALKLEPHSPWLREYLEFLFPNSLISSDERREKVDQLLAKETKISDYPKADAVILLDKVEEVVFKNGNSSYTIHRIIKIFNDQGKRKYGEIEISYNADYQRVKVKKATTIKKDGTEVEATEIRTLAVIEQNMYSDAQILSISMPELENEAIIEYIITVEDIEENIFPGHFWSTFYFQEYDPVKVSKYILTIPAEMEIKIIPRQLKIEPKVEKKEETITYIWEVKNSPALISEVMMPPNRDILPQVSITTIPSWEEVARWYGNLCQERFEPSPSIKEMAEKLTADLEKKEEKIKAIYHYILSKIRYVGLEFGVSAYQPYPAWRVLKNKYGDCKDKAGLMVAFLKAVGIESYPALVSTNEHGKINLDFFSPAQFNHALCVVPKNEEEFIFLDLTAEDWEFGTLPPAVQGVKAFIIKGKQGIFSQIPLLPPQENQFFEKAKITLFPDGKIRAEVTIEPTGFFSALYRGALKDKKTERENLEREANEDCQGAKLLSYQLSQVDDLNEKMRISYQFEAENFAQRSKEKLIFSPLLRPLNFTTLTTKSERKFPFLFNFYWQCRCEVEIILPTGFKVESLPENVSLETPYGSYTLTLLNQKNRILCQRNFIHCVRQIEVEEYHNLKAFYEKFSQVEKMQVIIKKRK